MDCEFTIADGKEESKVALWQISTREKVMDFLNYFFPRKVEIFLILKWKQKSMLPFYQKGTDVISN